MPLSAAELAEADTAARKRIKTINEEMAASSNQHTSTQARRTIDKLVNSGMIAGDKAEQWLARWSPIRFESNEFPIVAQSESSWSPVRF